MDVIKSFVIQVQQSSIVDIFCMEAQKFTQVYKKQVFTIENPVEKEEGNYVGSLAQGKPEGFGIFLGPNYLIMGDFHKGHVRAGLYYNEISKLLFQGEMLYKVGLYNGLLLSCSTYRVLDGQFKPNLFPFGQVTCTSLLDGWEFMGTVQFLIEQNHSVYFQFQGPGLFKIGDYMVTATFLADEIVGVGQVDKKGFVAVTEKAEKYVHSLSRILGDGVRFSFLVGRDNGLSQIDGNCFIMTDKRVYCCEFLGGNLVKGSLITNLNMELMSLTAHRDAIIKIAKRDRYHIIKIVHPHFEVSVRKNLKKKQLTGQIFFKNTIFDGVFQFTNAGIISKDTMCVYVNDLNVYITDILTSKRHGNADMYDDSYDIVPVVFRKDIAVTNSDPSDEDDLEDEFILANKKKLQRTFQLGRQTSINSSNLRQGNTYDPDESDSLESLKPVQSLTITGQRRHKRTQFCCPEDSQGNFEESSMTESSFIDDEETIETARVDKISGSYVSTSKHFEKPETRERTASFKMSDFTMAIIETEHENTLKIALKEDENTSEKGQIQAIEILKEEFLRQSISHGRNNANQQNNGFNDAEVSDESDKIALNIQHYVEMEVSDECQD